MKAFNSITHDILLSKLKTLNFSLFSLKLIRSFIEKRLQCVKVEETFSDWIELKQEVQQGTVLGPLLFNLYLNDISNALIRQTKIVQYAEDCLVFSCDIYSVQLYVVCRKA